jgi:hypothetical protein
MSRTPFPATLAMAVATLVLVACSSSGGGSPAPSTAADAVRLVLAVDERFAGIEERDPDMIGQSAYYEVSESNDGWRVQIYVGWGDCPAGCISHHIWLYDVSRDGSVRLVSEEGEPLPNESGFRGLVTAGPTSPLVTGDRV